MRLSLCNNFILLFLNIFCTLQFTETLEALGGGGNLVSSQMIANIWPDTRKYMACSLSI